MIIRKTLSPFKGLCMHCHKRTNVRLYPYNTFEWLGVLCKECFKQIAADISAGGVFVDDGEPL